MLKRYCLPHNLSLGARRAPNTYNKEKKKKKIVLAWSKVNMYYNHNRFERALDPICVCEKIFSR